MRRIDIFKRAGKNLRRAKLRTVLTALAIAVGATTISLAFAAGKGGKSYIDGLAGKIGDMNSLSVSRMPSEEESRKDPYALEKIDENSAPEKTEKELRVEDLEKYSLLQSDVEAIRKISGVKSVNPSVALNLKSARLEDSAEKFSVNAVAKTDEQPFETTASALKDSKILPNGKVVAPKSFAAAVKMGEKDLLGKKVVLEFRKENDSGFFEKTFEIAAVDKGKTDTQYSYPNAFWLSNADGLSVAGEQNLGGKMYFGDISVQVEDTSRVAEVQGEILKIDSSRYRVNSFSDSYKTINQALNVATAGLVGFGVLAILASVFGIINTQYISVLERTSQIGLMKSLGARRGDISKMFRYEAAWIGLLGGVLGVVIAAIFSAILNPFMTNIGFKTLDVGGDLLQMDWLASVVMVLALVLVAVVSGYFPARKAAKMNPIEALRAE